MKERAYVVEWHEMANQRGGKRVRGMMILPTDSGSTIVTATSAPQAKAIFRAQHPRTEHNHFIVDSVGLVRSFIRVHD